jgi:hypothetical protein
LSNWFDRPPPGAVTLATATLATPFTLAVATWPEVSTLALASVPCAWVGDSTLRPIAPGVPSAELVTP